MKMPRIKDWTLKAVLFSWQPLLLIYISFGASLCGFTSFFCRKKKRLQLYYVCGLYLISSQHSHAHVIIYQSDTRNSNNCCRCCLQGVVCWVPRHQTTLQLGLIAGVMYTSVLTAPSTAPGTIYCHLGGAGRPLSPWPGGRGDGCVSGPPPSLFCLYRDVLKLMSLPDGQPDRLSSIMLSANFQSC